MLYIFDALPSLFRKFSTFKTISIFTITLLNMPFSTYAAFNDIDMSNVTKIKEKNNGSYKVHCENKNKGVIAIEENQLCTFVKDKRKKRCEDTYDATEENKQCKFSQQNLKNICQDQNTWSVEEAAAFICQD